MLDVKFDKYRRTYHFPFSPEIHSDDKTLSVITANLILANDIIISVKLDGGNCCITTKGVFARSHNEQTKCSSFDYIKNKHFYCKLHLLNKDYEYYGENMYAIHSIEYLGLNDYFYLFNIYDSVRKVWLSFDELEKEAKRCSFSLVPIIYKGKGLSTKDLMKFLEDNLKKTFLGGVAEGFVIRVSKEFKNEDFASSIGKYVRKGHVQTDEHWSNNWVAAKLKKKD